MSVNVVTIELTTAAPTVWSNTSHNKTWARANSFCPSKPGTTSAKSERSYNQSASSWSDVIAVIETAISWIDSSFLVAVTTTSSISCAKEIEKTIVRNRK